MKLKEFHFGIAHLDDGSRVITPYGPVGPIYQFSESSYRRFHIAIRVVVVLFVWLCMYAAFFSVSPQGNLRRAANLIILGTVFLDLSRVTATMLLFRGHTKVKVSPRIVMARDVVIFMYLTTVPLLVLSTFFEIISFSGLCADLLRNSNKYQALLPVLLLAHFSFYVTRFLKARRDR
jgi:hypothetical protein